jgi:tripartite-type tricarboxylate transporter receptor subunit TctC
MRSIRVPRYALCGIFTTTILLAAAAAASAETWPTRVVKVISPFTAGNAGDTVARIVLEQVSQMVASRTRSKSAARS